MKNLPPGPWKEYDTILQFIDSDLERFEGRLILDKDDYTCVIVPDDSWSRQPEEINALRNAVLALPDLIHWLKEARRAIAHADKYTWGMVIDSGGRYEWPVQAELLSHIDNALKKLEE